MKKLLKVFGLVAVFSLSVRESYAQTISTGSIQTSNTIGNIATLDQLFIFIFNLLQYFGWAGVVIGVVLALFGLIYKLIKEDNEKVMATVQGAITKAIVIIIAGILLISAGFIVRVIGELFGIPTLGLDFSQGRSG